MGREQALPAEEVAATLRESLDHLKLSIDAMNLPRGDINGLLASLRYRLQRRIAQAGMVFVAVAGSKADGASSMTF